MPILLRCRKRLTTERSIQAPFGPISDQIFGTKTLKFENFQIVTLREAKRGSAGVLVAKREAAGDTQSVQEMTT